MIVDGKSLDDDAMRSFLIIQDPMKKIIAFFLFTGMVICASAQYVPINIIRAEDVTINSKEGIVVQGTTVNQDRSITVTFMNANYDQDNERNTYTFEWYLSYKGKRVSDYYTEAVRCRRTKNRTVDFWPDEVPKGYEKYVTVQLGREPRKRDPRDDD